MNLQAMTLRELMELNQRVAAEIARRVLGDQREGVAFPLAGTK